MVSKRDLLFRKRQTDWTDSHVSPRQDPRQVVTNAAYLLFYRRRETPKGHPLGGTSLETIYANHDAAADSETMQESRESSPGTGEGLRLGVSSHNGSPSAFKADPGHRVGADGLAQESRGHGLLAGTGHPKRLSETALHDELPAYSEMQVDDADEGINMDYQPASQQGVSLPWEENAGWGFDQINNQHRLPQPSEDGILGDHDSNDSTRVEGDAASPTDSLLLETDSDLTNMIYSEPDYGHRSSRESAPPPEISSGFVDDVDDDDDLPVVELKADPQRPGDEMHFDVEKR